MSVIKKLRIDFQVREVLDDGSPGDARYVTMGDDVDPAKVKDFFERTGLSVQALFGTHQVVTGIVLRQRPRDIIGTIKLVRVLTGCGLKEAKDRVESPYGTVLVFAKGSDDTEHLRRAFRDHGISETESIPVDENTCLNAGVPLYVNEDLL